MRKRIVTALLVMGLTYTASAQSLDQFIEMAIQTHPQLKSELTKHEALKTQEEQASRWQDPVLSAGYTPSDKSMERASVSLMQNFAWFGTTKLQKDAARMAVRSNDNNVAALQKQITVDVSGLYFEIQATDQLIALQKKNLLVYAEFEKLATHKLSTAKGNMVDVVLAELSKENAAIQITLLEQKRHGLVYGLNKLVQREGEEPITIEAQQYSPSLMNADAMMHPEIQAITLKKEEMDIRTQVAEKESLPNLSVGVEYMRMNPGSNVLMPMVGMTIPIYRKKYKAKIQETKLLSDAYEQEKSWAINQLYRERSQVNTELLQASQELDLYTKQIAKVEKAKELLLTYYSTAGQDFEELLRLQQEQFTYESTLITKQAEALKLEKQAEYLHFSVSK